MPLADGEDIPCFLWRGGCRHGHQQLISNAQTTIPQSVRTALGVAAGDVLAYAIEDGRVILTKAPVRTGGPGDSLRDPFATFWEWASAEDEQDFRDL